MKFIYSIPEHEIVYGKYSNLWELINDNAGIIVSLASIIIACISVGIAYFSYCFQKKRLDADVFIKVMDKFGDDKHRKVRDILYHWHKNNGLINDEDPKLIEGLQVFGIESPENLIESCKNMVRSDINGTSTLIKHGLLSRNLFVNEYYWIILKSCDCLEGEIYERRKEKGPERYMENFENERNHAIKYYKKIEKKRMGIKSR
jgi:hypothetical protein